MAMFVGRAPALLAVGVAVAGLVCASPPAAEAQEASDSAEATPESPQEGEAQDEPDSTEVTRQVGSDPAVGFDPTAFNPFFIQSPTGKHRLTVGAYAQIRYEVNRRNGVAEGTAPVEQGWSLNRGRFFLEGRYSDRFDLRLAVNYGSDGQFDLQQAYFTHHFGDLWSVSVGKQFYNSMREDWPDPTLTASMDNSAVDYTFALGTAFGASFSRAPTEGGNVRWWLAVNNGAYGSNRTFAQSDESDVMVFGRLDYQVVGTDWSVWDDLIGGRGKPRTIMVGVSPGFAVLKNEMGGMKGNVAQLNVDVNFNGDGYQVVLAGVWNWFVPESGPSYSNYGVYFQAAYFFAPKWQGYVRYDFVAPGDQPGDYESYRAPGVGVSYFPGRSRRWRFTAEVNHLLGALNQTIVGPVAELGWLPSDSGGQTALRVQVQFGF